MQFNGLLLKLITFKYYEVQVQNNYSTPTCKLYVLQ